MITGAHVVLHTPQADAVRDVFRDVLHWEHVDAGRGWLIFALPPAELGIHPSDGEAGHQLLFMCDDLAQTVEELRAKGLEVKGPPVEHDWGTATTLVLPGNLQVTLYEPKHPLAARPNVSYEAR